MKVLIMLQLGKNGEKREGHQWSAYRFNRTLKGRTLLTYIILTSVDVTTVNAGNVIQRGSRLDPSCLILIVIIVILIILIILCFKKEKEVQDKC